MKPTMLKTFMRVTEEASGSIASKIGELKDKSQKAIARGVSASVATATIAVSGTASAITAPAAGSFGYDVYDLAVNQILKGPFGFVGGCAGVAYSATLLSKNWITAVLGILASSAVLKADAITTSLGLVM